MRLHIALLTMLGNGHVYPVLPICSELVRRGYRVTVPINDHYLQNVLSTGAEPVPYRSTPTGPAYEEYLRSLASLPANDPRWFNVPDAAWSYLETSSTDLLTQLEAFYTEHPPGLIVFDQYLYAARILADRLNVRAVQVSPHFAYYDGFWVRQNGVCRNPRGTLEFSERLDAFFWKQGVKTRNNLWHAEETNIHLIPQAFQHHGDRFDSRYLFAGRSQNRKFTPTWQDNSGGRPIVLIAGYNGLIDANLSTESYFALFTEALAESEFHCILSSGDNTSDPNVTRIPGNFELNRKASHLEILPHAALFICHGGMGSCLDSISCGTPVLTIPTNPYTDEIGYRVAEMGLGANVQKEELTLDTARHLVASMVTDSRLGERVAHMRTVFAEQDGVPVAVDRILQ